MRLKWKTTPRYRIQKFLSHSNYLIHRKRKRNDSYLHRHHIEAALLKMSYSRKQIPRPKSKCRVIRSYICRFCELQPTAECNVPYPAFEMEHVPVPSLDFDPASRHKSLSSPTSRHILSLIPHFAKPLLCSTLTFSIKLLARMAPSRRVFRNNYSTQLQNYTKD